MLHRNPEVYTHPPVVDCMFYEYNYRHFFVGTGVGTEMMRTLAKVSELSLLHPQPFAFCYYIVPLLMNKLCSDQLTTFLLNSMS